MKQNKTQKTNESVELFLSAVKDDQKQTDSYALVEMMGMITKTAPHLWGTTIIGFGEYHYRYKSGREGDWFLTGFSPRKQALTLYLMCDLSHEDLNFSGLGKYKKGKGCLYIKRLSDINTAILERLIHQSIAIIKRTYA